MNKPKIDFKEDYDEIVALLRSDQDQCYDMNEVIRAQLSNLGIKGYLQYKTYGKILPGLPMTAVQRGPNCGYYALAAAALALKFQYPNEDIKTHPARKRDLHYQLEEKKGDKISLRQIGKPKQGSTPYGAIYDLKLFNAIAEEINMQGDIIQFTNFEEFMNALRTNIDKGYPLIIPFNVDENAETLTPTSSEPNSSSAHHALIIGYCQIEGEDYVCLTENEELHHIKARVLFQSNHDLNFFPETTITKASNTGNQDKEWFQGTLMEYMKAHDFKATSYSGKHIQPQIELDGLKDQMIAVHPRGRN